MLTIEIPDNELWNEQEERFIRIKGQTLHLEHSLVSLSKWESKYCRAFLTNKEKSTDEIVDYIRMMTLDKNVDPVLYYGLTNDNIIAINDYISAPMTATHFSDEKNGKTNSETVTAELIYYWMIALNVPFECQKWHLNRLLSLIRVCEIKNQPSKKMPMNEIKNRNAALNAARRKQLNTKG